MIVLGHDRWHLIIKCTNTRHTRSAIRQTLFSSLPFNVSPFQIVSPKVVSFHIVRLSKRDCLCKVKDCSTLAARTSVALFFGILDPLFLGPDDQLVRLLPANRFPQDVKVGVAGKAVPI